MYPDATWLVPWNPITDGRPDDTIANELYTELCRRHVLYGLKVRPVGHRQDCDDFLFELLDGSDRYAAVHLTYAQHPEPDPTWPETIIFKNWPDFVRAMEADAEEWNT